MQVANTVVLFILLQSLVSAYFEQRLIRRATGYYPSSTRVDIAKFKPDGCSPELLTMNHNATYATQICFKKDLFLNMEVMIGEDSTDVYEMALDLTSPWTWVKSKKCKNCPKIDPVQFEDPIECGKTKLSCVNSDFVQTYDSSTFQDSLKTAKIYSEDFMVYGTFVEDDIKFLSYNSSHNGKLDEFIRAKLDMNETLDEIALKDLRFLSVNRIYGGETIQSDGMIGLGFGYTETEEEEAQPNTDFVEKLIKEQTQLKLARQQFAIYILETGPYFKHFVVQFGGYDVKYAHQHSNDVIWLNRLENSGYYWMVTLNSFYMNYYQKVQADDYIQIQNKKAIFTLSSQFIELPKDELTTFLQKMNNVNNLTDCHLIDEEVLSQINKFYQQLMVFCNNLVFPSHFNDLKLHFKFETNQGQKDLELNSFLIYRNCTQHKDDSDFFDCLLNIRYSQSEYVILGEPFMKWHYVIFLNDPGLVQQIGILPAATNMYYKDHPKSIFESEGWQTFKVLVYIFLAGMMLLFCVTNFKHFVKDLYRTIRYSGSKINNDSGQLRVRTYEENTSDFKEEYEKKVKEVEEEENAKKEREWKKSQEEFNFSKQFEEHSL